MLAILATHPIQYQVPLWQALAKDGRVPFEVWYLTSHATKKSHDVEFGKEFSWDLDMLAGYPHKFLDVARGATPNSFWKCRLKEKLRDRLRKSGVRALWIQGWQVAAYWQAVREAKAASVEVWLRGESNDLRERTTRPRDNETTGPRSVVRGQWSGGPKSWLKTVLLRQLFRRVDRFLYIGSANKRLYQKFGVPDEKLFPAPYAVDDARFARQAGALRGKRQELRDAWNIPRDAFVILFCGKFISKKRPMDLIAAAQLLRSKQSGKGQEQSMLTSSRLPLSAAKPHLLFVGSGDLGPQMRAACNVVFDAENLSSSLVTGHLSLPIASFAGFLNQTEISKAYVAADVLVLPSDYNETWGLVVNEAIASGLPCIISDRCGCAEDLGLIAANAIYECGNIESLTRALMRFEQPGSRMVATSDLKDYSFDKTVSTIASIWSR